MKRFFSAGQALLPKNRAFSAYMPPKTIKVLSIAMLFDNLSPSAF